MKSKYLPFLLLAALAIPAWGADKAALEKQYHDQIQQLLPGMAAKEIPDRKDSQQTLEKLGFELSAPGKETEREALSKAMMSFVGPETEKPARVWLLRKIEPLGREEVVGPLSKLLHDSDPEIIDLARRALANNPSEKALAVLRAELASAKLAEWKVALINALAWRHDLTSVSEFAKAARDRDATVAAAGISALGEVAGDQAVKTLADLRKSAPAELKASVIDASLRAAERQLAAGKADSAKAIYSELAEAAQPENIRIAALTGLANIPGSDALATLLKCANGEDGHLRLIAARCLARLPAEGKPARQISAAMHQAAPEAKALLIEVLGERGEKQALPAVMAYMDDKDGDVRAAAYEAIGKLGTAPTVHVLVVQGASKPADREAIRNSLASLKGPGVDEEIVRMLSNAQGAGRIELIMAVWSRRIAAAKTLVLRLAGDPDEGTRVAVLTALERLANEADLAQLADMLIAAKSDAEIKAAQEAIASICRRAGDPEKCVAPLAETLAKAQPAGKVAIIQLLTKLQGQAALTAVRAAASSDEPKVKEAAQAALAQWKPVSIANWIYAGPFRQEGKGATELFDIAFPPESGTAAEWKQLKHPGADGRFDLTKVAKGDNCCIYVKTMIQSRRKQDVVLAIGSDDGVKVWLNDKVVHANNATRALKCGEDQVKLTLNEGENALLLKVTQGAADFAFCCSIKAADGAPADGVRFEAR